MQTQSKLIISVIFLILLILAAFKLLARPPVPDTTQIQNQLSHAVDSANAKDVSGVMSIISANYTDSDDNNPTRLSVLLQHGLASSGNINVSAAPATISLQGDQAVSSCYLTIQADGQTIFAQVLELNWQKEETRRFFIIPDETWRVIRSSYAGVLDGS